MGKDTARILHIDAIRGLMILLVIYWHIFCMLSPVTMTRMLTLFPVTAMPVFFFIAGYFMYRDNYTHELLRRKGRERIVKVLYPTLLIGLLFCLATEVPLYPDALLDQFKNGYWFTYVAVEMFLFFIPPVVVLSEHGRSRAFKAWSLIGLVALVEVVYYTDLLPRDISGILCYDQIADYAPYLILGMIAKMYAGRFEKVISSRRILIACCVIFAVLYLQEDLARKSMLFGTFRYYLLSIAAIVILNILFFHIYKVKALASNFVMKGLAFIGTCTLEIYLLHYFIIFGIKNYLQGPELMEWLRGLSNTVYELPVSLAVSVVFALICIGFVRLLKLAGIHRFVFPSAMPQWRLSLKGAPLQKHS